MNMLQPSICFLFMLRHRVKNDHLLKKSIKNEPILKSFKPNDYVFLLKRRIENRN